MKLASKKIGRVLAKALHPDKPGVLVIPRLWNKYGFFYTNNKAFGIPERIKEPQLFGNVFPEGSRVLCFHFDSTDPRTAVVLLRMMKTAIPRLKKRGFAGAYGDTPNLAIIRAMKKNFDAKILPSPFETALNVIENYNTSAQKDGYPKKYAQLENVKRIVVAF
ncbi:MAG: hypothetical protein PHH08_02635 [Candidatus ainarchaeum sp.]|nr:hypothetical protein [Candidatus ainarchaeum sp.]